jgi:diguanylate cyclase (GGDEF)-like protein
VEPSDRRIRRSWSVLSAAFLLLGLVAVGRVLAAPPEPFDWIVVALVAIAGAAALNHARAVRSLEAGRGAEAASFARILSGLSRSVSADAIVDAIVEELGVATGADHLVVVRRRTDARVLEARLVSARTGVPDSTTLLPIADLEDPVTPGESVEDRLASRVKGIYGLADPIAAPLVTEDGTIGAIVLSRRSGAGWPDATHRLLHGAASEASAALARAYSLRAAEARATTDALTGLPNRRYFDEFVGLLARRRRAGDAVGILMVDIDRFKQLNDRYGHATGDDVLRAVGGAIVGAVREDDVPVRFGGEEFVVLLRNPDPEVAFEVGERIRTAVGELDLQRFGVPSVSVSVGVAVAEQPDEPIHDLIETADRALYRAKRAGRDRVVAA